MLAVIDRNWLASFEQKTGVDDVLRFELETAIRLGKTIVPLFVGGYRPEISDLLPRLPESLHPLFAHHAHFLDDGTPAAYETSIDTLINAIEHLDTSVAPVEDAVIELLMAEDYVAAERLLIRQPSFVRNHADLSAYLALARLGGRSFNALYPAERETIETLLRRAQDGAADPTLPKLLLAILEIDYYELNGIASKPSVKQVDVTREMPERSRALISHLQVSRRARRELRLDQWTTGAPR